MTNLVSHLPSHVFLYNTGSRWITTMNNLANLNILNGIEMVMGRMHNAHAIYDAIEICSECK